MYEELQSECAEFDDTLLINANGVRSNQKSLIFANVMQKACDVRRLFSSICIM